MARKLTKDDAADIALHDAAGRVGVDTSSVRVDAAEPAEFPNSALGAPRAGEMSADMMTSGWKFRVTAGDRSLEYRANERQVRLVGFDGGNHVVYPG